MTGPAARTVIVDCDPGTDDAIALWLALASPELEVSLVTVSGGNAGIGRTVANACAVTSLARSGVPVVRGADRPLLGRFVGEERVHGADGLAGISLPPGRPPADGVAADAIRDALRAASPGSVTIVGIAPVTNLALALATEPALTSKVGEVVLMGGAWGEGNWTPAAEFNAASDPEALAVVAGLGVPLTVVALELTAQALVTPARRATLGARGDGACLRAALDIMGATPDSRRLGGAGHPLHDPCAVAWLLAPRLFRAREAGMTVECGTGPGRGRTHLDRWGRARGAATVTLPETLDADGFFDLLGERLAGLP